MRKNFFKFSLLVVLMISGFVSLLFALTAEPNVTYYGCDGTSQVESTTQVDSDGDGRYDTYIVKWCNPNYKKEYQVQYGFKGLDRDELEDEWAPRPWDTPQPKQKPKTKKPKIVLANPLTGAFIEEVYLEDTGNLAWWWESKDNSDVVTINVPVQPITLPKVSINSNNFTSSNVALLPDPNTNNVKLYFTVSEQNRVTINVFNQTGMNVAVLLDENKSTGDHEVSFNTASLPNGLYFVQSKIGSSLFTQKLLLAK